jgi:hypothetical protein
VPAPFILRALGRGSWGAALRQVVAVAVVVTAATTFALFSPAYRYVQSEGYRQASFDLWINGPIDMDALGALRGLDPGGTYATVSDISPRYLEAGERRAAVDNGRFFASASEISIVYPDALRIAGVPFDQLAPGDVVLDRQTADALGVTAGDGVTVSLLGSTGQERTFEVRIGAVVLASAHLRNAIGGVLTPEWRQAIPPDIPPYSSLFVITRDGMAFEEGVPAVGSDYQVFRRTDLLNDAVAQANQLIDRSREMVFLGLAAAVLAVFVTRDLRALLRLRTRACAILIALGVRPAAIARVIVLEQAVLLTVAITLGVGAGVAWFGLGFQMPIPAGDLGLAVTTFALLSGGGLVCVVLVVRRELERVPITRLLFEGQ